MLQLLEQPAVLFETTLLRILKKKKRADSGEV
jgi:hypothetical protein